MKSRTLAALLTVALMAAGTGGVIAGGGGDSGGSASKSQYKPGCGPKKTDGVNPSGTHTGHDGDRSDCPGDGEGDGGKDKGDKGDGGKDKGDKGGGDKHK